MKHQKIFFKNRVSFTPNFNQPLPTFFSEKMFNPEDYSIDFLKEKTKSICYYLYSALGIVWFRAEIYLQEIEEYAEVSIQSEKITEIQHTLFFGSDCFLWKIEHCLNEVKTKFCHQMHTKPFRIMIIPANSLDGNEEENEEEGRREGRRGRTNN